MRVRSRLARRVCKLEEKHSVPGAVHRSYYGSKSRMKLAIGALLRSAGAFPSQRHPLDTGRLEIVSSEKDWAIMKLDLSYDVSRMQADTADGMRLVTGLRYEQLRRWNILGTFYSDSPEYSLFILHLHNETEDERRIYRDVKNARAWLKKHSQRAEA